MTIADALNLHGRIFGHAGNGNWNEIYPAWSQLFQAEGIPGPILEKAVNAVFRRSVQPRWPSEHLQALREEIHAARAHESANREAAVVNSIVCRYCGDTGTVVDLPHLCQITNNEWEFFTRGIAPYFTSVICDQCLVGKSKPRDIPDNRRLATLGEYAHRNPKWREQVRRFMALRRAKSDAWAATTIHDTQIGEGGNRHALAKRMIDRLGLPATSMTGEDHATKGIRTEAADCE
jgi:hypothetical protein